MRRILYTVLTNVFGSFLIFASGFGYGTLNNELSVHYELLPKAMGIACAISGWLLLRCTCHGPEPRASRHGKV